MTKAFMYTKTFIYINYQMSFIVKWYIYYQMNGYSDLI